MMFSGHTYVCSIFSLGLYDLLRNRTARFGPWLRHVLRLTLGVCLSLLVFFDVILILINRFHYTMDVVVALVLVLLFFSNPAIAVASEHWSAWANGEQSLSREWNGQSGDLDLPRDHPEADERDRGSVLVPPCCLPLCCFAGRYHLHERPDLHEGFLADLHALESSFGQELEDLQHRLTDSEAQRRRSEDRSVELGVRLERAMEAKEQFVSEATEARKTTEQERQLRRDLEKRVEQMMEEYRTKEAGLQEEQARREEAERVVREMSRASREILVKNSQPRGRPSGAGEGGSRGRSSSMPPPDLDSSPSAAASGDGGSGDGAARR